MAHYIKLTSHDSSESLSVVNFLNSEAITRPRRFQAIRNDTETLVMQLNPVRSTHNVTRSSLCQGTLEADMLAILARSRAPVTEVVTMFLIEASGGDIVYRSRACTQLIPRLLRSGMCDSCLGLLENVRQLEQSGQSKENKQDNVKEESSSSSTDYGYECDALITTSTLDDAKEENGHNEVPKIINFAKKLKLIDKVRRNPANEDNKSSKALMVRKCPYCSSKQQCSEEMLVNHIKDYHKEQFTIEYLEKGLKLWQCEEEGCGKVFLNNKRLRTHFKRVHVVKSKKWLARQEQKCPFCDKIFRKRGNRMIKHIKLFHETQAETEAYKNFFLETYSSVCPQCGTELLGANVGNHKCTFNLVSCHICGKNVKSDYLQKHVERHQKHDIEVCSHCGKFFDNKVRFQCHKRICGLEKGSFKCPDCDKVFDRETGRNCLNEHIRKVHRQESNYKCDQCDKKYFKKKQLLEHITAVHDQIKAFICEKCGFRTAKHNNLNIHRKKSHGLEYMGRSAMMDMIQSGGHPYIDINYEYLYMIKPKTTVILNKI